jgi:hypothetical protein
MDSGRFWRFLNRGATGISGKLLAGLLALSAPAMARADVVVDWTVLAGNTAGGVNGGARNMAVVSLAMFEAVNAITGDYEPYLGTVSAPNGASPEAAAVAAAYRVLRTYVTAPATVAALDAARAASLAAIPDGQAKDDGIAVGEDAAADLIALAAKDGSSPAAFFEPPAPATSVWQATPSCPVNPATGLRVGTAYQVASMTPLAIPSPWAFRPEPPPSADSYRYYKAQLEVMIVGGVGSTERPADRTDVARFYNGIGNTYGVRLIASQLALARGDTLAQNARNFALIAMAVNDAFIGSFEAKYHYGLWRPETAIRAGADDGNRWTVGDTSFVPLITTPCFPTYPSNHASGSSASLEMMRRLYGEAGHNLTLDTPALPGVVLHYTALHQILADVSDARVYGGIHFRFDQEAGERLGREVATFVEKNYLRPIRP